MATIPPGFRRLWSEAQALTRATPTLATEGMDLDEVNGFRVILEADVGQTLSGAGTLLAWYYDQDLGAWMRNPDLDLTVPAGAAGLRRIVFADLPTAVPFGRVLFASSGVTVSSGGVTPRIVASTAFLRR